MLLLNALSRGHARVASDVNSPPRRRSEAFGQEVQEDFHFRDPLPPGRKDGPEWKVLRLFPFLQQRFQQTCLNGTCGNMSPNLKIQRPSITRGIHVALSRGDRVVAEAAGIERIASERARNKVIDHIDDICRMVIAASPFVIVASRGGDGQLDVSPKIIVAPATASAAPTNRLNVFVLNLLKI